MEDIIDIIVTETTNLIEITSQPTDEIIDVNIIDNREDVTLNVTPTVVEININSLTGNFGVNWGEITGTLSNQTDLQNALNLKADLVGGKVPSSQLPSYVDDVIEVANYAALPATGETGKIYVTIDTNYIYRWTGSVYVEIKDSSAVWGAITGTLSNQTDLQNALNAKANDNAVVHLAGTETIMGAKTFSSAVTAPNFVLSGGTRNTGLYYGHTDRVVLANYTTGGIDFEVNGGSIVATLFPSGNYGLGITLDAGYKLDVNGTARISGALSGTSASFSSSITASSIIKSGGTSSQFLKADGSVDSSTYLTTSSAASTYLAKSGGTLTGALSGTSATFSGEIQTTQGIYINRASLPYIQFAQSGTAFGQIRGNGTTFGLTDANGTTYYLGLNASTGAATFSSSVTAGGRILTTASGNDTFGFQMYKSGTTTTLAGFYQNTTGDGLIAAYNSAGTQNVQIATNGVSYFNGGNVGIGTTSPAHLLQLGSGANTGSQYARFFGSGSDIYIGESGGVLFGLSARSAGYVISDNSSNPFLIGTIAGQPLLFGTANTERMRITSGGNVLIGQTVASGSTNGIYFRTGIESGFIVTNDVAIKLSRFSSDGQIQTFFRDTTLVGSISITTVMTSYNVTSDYRLKEDFKSINGLDIVNKIKVYDYKWKADNSRMDGVLAHELQEVLPYAVTGVKDGKEMQQVDYSKIVPVLIQSIKELKSKIETLETK